MRILWCSRLVILSVMSILLTSTANAATPPNSGDDCAWILLRQLTIDHVLPMSGRGLIEMFPSALVPDRNARILLQVVQSHNPQRSPLLAPPASTSTSFVYNALSPSSPSSEGKNLLVTPAGTNKMPEVASLAPKIIDSFVSANPLWRRVNIEVRDIQSFEPDSTINHFETPDSPIVVLPREWQWDILFKMLQEPPSNISKSQLRRLMVMTKNTDFSIDGSPPQQKHPRVPNIMEIEKGAGGGVGMVIGAGLGLSSSRLDDLRNYRGNLDPKDTKLRSILERMREHYFAPGVPLDEATVRSVLRRHFYFNIVAPKNT